MDLSQYSISDVIARVNQRLAAKGVTGPRAAQVRAAVLSRLAEQNAGIGGPADPAIADHAAGEQQRAELAQAQRFAQPAGPAVGPRSNVYQPVLNAIAQAGFANEPDTSDDNSLMGDMGRSIVRGSLNSNPGNMMRAAGSLLGSDVLEQTGAAMSGVSQAVVRNDPALRTKQGGGFARDVLMAATESVPNLALQMSAGSVSGPLGFAAFAAGPVFADTYAEGLQAHGDGNRALEEAAGAAAVTAATSWAQGKFIKVGGAKAAPALVKGMAPFLKHAAKEYATRFGVGAIGEALQNEAEEVGARYLREYVRGDQEAWKGWLEEMPVRAAAAGLAGGATDAAGLPQSFTTSRERRGSELARLAFVAQREEQAARKKGDAVVAQAKRAEKLELMRQAEEVLGVSQQQAPKAPAGAEDTTDEALTDFEREAEQRAAGVAPAAPKAPAKTVQANMAPGWDQNPVRGADNLNRTPEQLDAQAKQLTAKAMALSKAGRTEEAVAAWESVKRIDEARKAMSGPTTTAGPGDADDIGARLQRALSTETLKSMQRDAEAEAKRLEVNSDADAVLAEPNADPLMRLLALSLRTEDPAPRGGAPTALSAAGDAAGVQVSNRVLRGGQLADPTNTLGTPPVFDNQMDPRFASGTWPAVQGTRTDGGVRGAVQSINQQGRPAATNAPFPSGATGTDPNNLAAVKGINRTAPAHPAFLTGATGGGDAGTLAAIRGINAQGMTPTPGAVSAGIQNEEPSNGQVETQGRQAEGLLNTDQAPSGGAIETQPPAPGAGGLSLPDDQSPDAGNKAPDQETQDEPAGYTRRPEREADIEKMVQAASKPMPDIVESLRLEGTDGNWYGPNGFPTGVTMTGRRRVDGFVYRSKDGSTGSQLFESREAAEKAWKDKQAEESEDFRRTMHEREDGDFASARDYWLGTPEPEITDALIDRAWEIFLGHAPADRLDHLKSNASRLKRDTIGALLKVITTGKFDYVVQPDNKISRKTFETLTGVKLPPSLSKTQEMFTGKPFDILPETKEDTKPKGDSKKNEPALGTDKNVGTRGSWEIVDGMIRVTFPSKPDTSILDRLKRAGFTWGGKKRPYWSAKATDITKEDANAAIGPSPAKKVGKNANGQDVYEDGYGVRSYAEGGLLVSETVNLTPTRGGISTGVDKSKRGPEFKTVEELAAENVDQQKKSEEDAARHRALVEIGQKEVPGIRLEDAADAGRMYSMLVNRQIGASAWNAYVADLYASGKAKKPDTDEGQGSAAQAAMLRKQITVLEETTIPGLLSSVLKGNVASMPPELATKRAIASRDDLDKKRAQLAKMEGAPSIESLESPGVAVQSYRPGDVVLVDGDTELSVVTQTHAHGALTVAKPSEWVKSNVNAGGRRITLKVNGANVRPIGRAGAMSDAQEAPKAAQSFKVEVSDNDGRTWATNGMRFQTREAADQWGADLMARWYAATGYRVAESDEPATHDAKGERLDKPKEPDAPAEPDHAATLIASLDSAVAGISNGALKKLAQTLVNGFTEKLRDPATRDEAPNSFRSALERAGFLGATVQKKMSDALTAYINAVNGKAPDTTTTDAAGQKYAKGTTLEWVSTGERFRGRVYGSDAKNVWVEIIEHDPSPGLASMVGMKVALDESSTDNGFTVVTDAETKTPEPAKAKASDFPHSIALVNELAALFANGETPFANIIEARKFFAPLLGTVEPGTANAKRVDELVEVAVVLASRAIVNRGRVSGDTAKAVYDQLVALYDAQPNLAVRTSTSMENQAYSTPVPLAWLASQLVGIDRYSTVYEPTAGNAMLLLDTDPDLTVANELNDERASSIVEIKAAGTVTTNDATSNKLAEPMDLVIANPPFGEVQVNGRPKKWKTSDGRLLTQNIDQAIVMESMAALRHGGRAVFIIGGVKTDITPEERAKAYRSDTKRPFFAVLYNNFRIVTHFTVDGDLYAKQGAKFPVDVLVVEKAEKNANQHFPWQTAPRTYSSWNELGELINGNTKLEAQGITAENVVSVSEEPRRGAGADGGTAAGNADGDKGSVSGGSGKSNGGSGGGRTRKPRPSRPAVDRSPAPTPQDAPASGDGRGGGDRGKSGSVDKPSVPGEGSSNQPAGGSGPTGGTPQPRPMGNGSGTAPNAGVTAPGSKAAEAMKRINERNKGRLNSGIDPNDFIDATVVAIELVKAGFSKFGHFAKTMVEGVGAWIKEHLKTIYQAAYEMDGVDKSVMDTPENVERMDVDAEIAALTEPKKDTEDNPAQVPYQSVSAGYDGSNSMNVLVPAKQADAIHESMRTLEKKVGPLDKYVVEHTGIPHAIVLKKLAAEQIDAVAQAIYQHKTGAALVIGDQTGIGKGRVVAALLMYANNNDMIPVFMTEKPKLYSDICGELQELGWNNVSLVPTNAEEGMKGAKAVYLPNGERLEGSDNASEMMRTIAQLHRQGKARVYKGRRVDVLVTTYDQTSAKGTGTAGEGALRRRAALANLATSAFIVLDEVHNAAGTEKNPQAWAPAQGTPPPRSDYIREILATAAGVMYSSATWAKRPGVLDLYLRTDIGRLTRSGRATFDQIKQAFEDGGIGLQQVVSTQLARIGQYMRRERTFAGVDVDASTVPADRRHADAMFEIFDALVRFDDAKDNWLEDHPPTEGPLAGGTFDSGQVDRQIRTTNFASVMHNIVIQYLLASKTNQAADEIVRSLDNGEKVVVALDNTLESQLKKFEADGIIRPGESCTITFADMIRRYAMNCRNLTVTNPDGTIEYHPLTDAEIGPVAAAMHEAVMEMIAKMPPSDVPVSPIDALRHRLEQREYVGADGTTRKIRTAEVTGRSMFVDYGDENKYKTRPVSDKNASRIITAFQDGDTDVVILNRSGATGISLHASKTAKDQRRRRMFILQSAPNIDVAMQMLGRVHRTGQVIPPAYTILSSDIAHEKRPLSVLAKKLASLNANVSSTRGGSMSMNLPDVMNEIGDRALLTLAIVDEGWRDMLELGSEDAARKRLAKIDERDEEYTPGELTKDITGTWIRRPMEEQEQYWNSLMQTATEVLDDLTRLGRNPLEAQTLDLQAETIYSAPDTQEIATGSWFTQGSTLETVRARTQSQVPTYAEVEAMIRKDNGLGDKESIDAAIAKRHGEWVKSIAQRHHDYVDADVKAKQNAGKDPAWIKRHRKAMAEHLAAFEAWANVMVPGKVVAVPSGAGGGMTLGIVVAIEPGVSGLRPSALSAWKVKTVTDDADSPVSTVSFASLAANSTPAKAYQSFDRSFQKDKFDTAATSATEIRHIVTGNILYSYVTGMAHASLAQNVPAQVVFFTRNNGTSDVGVILPRGSDIGAIGRNRSRTISKPENVVAFLRQATNSNLVEDTTGNLTLYYNKKDRDFIFSTPKNKASARWSGNEDVRDIAGADFVSSGGRMVLRLDTDRESEVLAIIKAFVDDGAVFRVAQLSNERPNSDDLDLADDLNKDGNEGTPRMSPAKRSPKAATERASKLDAADADLARLSTGNTMRAAEPANDLDREYDRFLKRLGLNPVWFTSRDEGLEGVVSRKDKNVYLRAGMDTDRAMAVPLHELLHKMRDLNPELFELLKKAAGPARIDAAIAAYRARLVAFAGPKSDFVRDFDASRDRQIEEGLATVMESMATDPEIRAAILAKPNIWARFKRWAKALLDKFGFGDGKSALRGAMLKAFDQMEKGGGPKPRGGGSDTRFSPAPPTNSAAFKAWFGKSKVVDEQGKPARLVHGTSKGSDFTVFDGKAFAAFGATDTDLTNAYARGDEGRSIPVYFKAEKPAYLEVELNDTIVPEGMGYDEEPTQPEDWDEDEMGEWNPPDDNASISLDSSTGSITEDALAEALNLDADEFNDLYRKALKENTGWFGYPQVWRLVNSKAFRGFLENGGYDSFTASEGGSPVWAVMNASQVKSATGNQGTYDPDNPDIRMSPAPAPAEESTPLPERRYLDAALVAATKAVRGAARRGKRLADVVEAYAAQLEKQSGHSVDRAVLAKITKAWLRNLPTVTKDAMEQLESRYATATKEADEPATKKEARERRKATSEAISEAVATLTAKPDRNVSERAALTGKLAGMERTADQIGSDAVRAMRKAHRQGKQVGAAAARAQGALALNRAIDALRMERTAHRMAQRSADAEGKVRNKLEYEGKIKAAVIRIADELPMRIKGKLIPAIKSATNVKHIVRAINRAKFEIARMGARDDMRIMARLAKRWGRTLNDTNRLNATQAMTAAVAAYKALRDIRVPDIKGFSTLVGDPATDAAETHATTISQALAAMKQAVNDQRIEDANVQITRKLGTDDVRRDLMEGLNKQKELPQADVPSGNNPGAVRNFFRKYWNVRSLMMKIDGKADTGAAMALFQRMKRAQRRHLADKHQFEDAAERITRAQGYSSLAQFMAEVSGTLGTQGQTVVQARLNVYDTEAKTWGTRKVQITLGQALYILASDPQTQHWAHRGTEFVFDDGKTTRFKIPDQTWGELERAVPVRALRTMKALKREYDRQYFNGLNDVSKTLNGRYLDKVQDYWGVRRYRADDELDGSKAMRDAIPALEAAGILQDRSGGRDPIIVGDFGTEIFRRSEAASHIVHKAKEVHILRATLLSRPVLEKIARVYGDKIRDRLVATVQEFAGKRIESDSLGKIISNINRSKVQLWVPTWLRNMGSIARLMSVMPMTDIAAGFAQWAKSPVETYRTLLKHSPELRERWNGSAGTMSFAMPGATTATHAGARKALAATMKQLVATLEPLLRLNFPEFRRRLASVDKPWTEMLDSLSIGNVFDSAAAGVAYHASKRRGMSDRVAAMAATEMFERVANTNTVLESTGLQQEAKASLWRAMLMSFTSDIAKAQNLIIQARMRSPRDLGKTLAGILLSIAFSASVTYAFNRLRGDEADTTLEATQKRLLKDLVSLAPLGNTLGGPVVERMMSGTWAYGRSAIETPIQGTATTLVEAGHKAYQAFQSLSDDDTYDASDKALAALKSAASATGDVIGLPVGGYLGLTEKAIKNYE